MSPETPKLNGLPIGVTIRANRMWLSFMSLLSLVCSVASGAEGRFPEPEFDSVYTAPGNVWPTGRSALTHWGDAVVLILCLALAAYLALRRRSRRGLFWLSLFCLAYFGFWRHGCVCSVGSFQNVAEAIGGSGFAVPFVVLVFFAAPLLTALVCGRVFCAAVCPLGAIQDLVVHRPRRVPRALAHALAAIPVVVLGLSVLLASCGTAYLTCRLDPFVPLFRFAGSVQGVVMGGAMLVLGVFVARPYCRFVCPYGVLLGWMSRLSGTHVTITPDTCVQCRLCEDACPFDAIRSPSPERPVEDVHRGMRRLGIILVLAPMVALLGGWLLSRLAVPLSRLNQDVLIAEQLAREGDGPAQTIETEAFRMGTESRSQLAARVAVLQRRLRHGAWWCSACIVLVLTCRTVRYSIRTRRLDYEPDRGDCLSCGRCFIHCPRERLRLRATPEGDPPDDHQRRS